MPTVNPVDRSSIYLGALHHIVELFEGLEQVAPKPRLVQRGSGTVFRYDSPSVHAAVIQKLARIVTGLHGMLALASLGQFQELGVLWRVADELEEDLQFLLLALIDQDGTIFADPKLTPLHETYLRYFYQEEFEDPDRPLSSRQNRGMVARDKIQAAIAKFPFAPVNPSDGQELRRTMSKAFSGYVHGASDNIMELYAGDPPRFQVRGMLQSDLEESAWAQLRHYFVRGITAMQCGALCFRHFDSIRPIMETRQRFMQAVGLEDVPQVDRWVRAIRKTGKPPKARR